MKGWKERMALNFIYGIPLLGWTFLGWPFDDVAMLYIYLILIDVTVYKRDWEGGGE